MVTQDARSGSSQVVCEKFLWGGGGGGGGVLLQIYVWENCRATILHVEKQSDFNDGDEMNECNEGILDYGEDGVTCNCDGRPEVILESASNTLLSARNLVEQQQLSNQNRKWKSAAAAAQTFVDNKP